MSRMLLSQPLPFLFEQDVLKLNQFNITSTPDSYIVPIDANAQLENNQNVEKLALSIG